MAKYENVSYEDILNFPYWYHRIPLDKDRYTPGQSYGPEAWDMYKLPDDLSGKSVLDIGSYNGLFAFAAERRGAERVLATDLWNEDNRPEVPRQEHRKEGFELVRSYLDSDVEGKSISVYDISPDSVGKFDIVLMPGVFYHLKHPFEAIQNICEVSTELVVVQSVLTTKYSKKVMEWTGEEGIENDPTVWWLPTLDCLEEMIQFHGCESTHSFYTLMRGPSNQRETIPPTNLKKLTQDSISLYKDYELTNEVGNYTVDGYAKTLYEKNGAVRIEIEIRTNRGLVEPVQGWVDADLVTGLNKNFELLQHTLDTYQKHGIVHTMKMIRGYVLNKSPRHGVVHGRF